MKQFVDEYPIKTDQSNNDVSKIDVNEYESFVQNHYKGHVFQSTKWANVKKDWTNELIIVRDTENKIKGTMSVLIRKLPIFNTSLMYSPRGPVCDLDDTDTFKKLILEADKLAKKYNSFMLRMDPDVLSSNEDFKNMAQKSGFKIFGKIKDLSRIMQPRFVFRLPLKGKSEEDIFNSFHSKTRYNIRLATKKGVTLREGSRDDLESFKQIMDITGKRDSFSIRSLEYFQMIYDSIGKENVKILFADYKGSPIACALNILYGNKEWYLYGGSCNEYRNLMPNYLIQWEMIKWAIENNCDIYDFRGICAIDENHKNEGLYRFKKGFNADLVEFIDMYKVYNPFMYFIFEHCAYAYKKVKLKILKLFK